jgi:hypothetical protein
MELLQGKGYDHRKNWQFKEVKVENLELFAPGA